MVPKVVSLPILMTSVLSFQACSTSRSWITLQVLQSPQEIVRLLNCTPEQDHETASVLELKDLNTACDLKIEAIRYLQYVYHQKEWISWKENPSLLENFSLLYQPEGLTRKDIASSVRFLDFEAANPFRGTAILTAELSSGTKIVFCNFKIFACSDRESCLHYQGCQLN